MEYLQYQTDKYGAYSKDKGFKPYYKWNTFNTFSVGLKAIASQLTF